MIRDWLRVKVRGKHIYKFNIIDATETDIRTDLTILHGLPKKSY